MKEPFELFVGFTGCGYTYSNKTVWDDGDYKKLAFVSAYTGEITWRVRPERIPSDVQNRIRHDSEVIKQKGESS